MGQSSDGGYVIAELPGTYDRLLSGGVGQNIDFERALLDAHPALQGDAFDGTVQGLPVAHERLTFHRQNLGNAATTGVNTWREAMLPYHDLFVKLDIEGHEFRLLPEIIAGGCMPRIKQLVLEIHTPADLRRAPQQYPGVGDVSHEFMFNLLAALNETHVLVHLHAVNFAPVHFVHSVPCPNVFECTYIRREFVQRFELNDSVLPTPLDKTSHGEAMDIYLRGYPYSTLDELDFTEAFKQRVAKDVLDGRKSLAAIAIENRLHPGLILRWTSDFAVRAHRDANGAA